jgi:hypothetical protein
MLTRRKAKPPTVSLRVAVSLPLFEKINTFRHEARHDSKNLALLCLLNAGLAALAKPPSRPQERPPQRLVAYTGAESDGRSRSAVNL